MTDRPLNLPSHLAAGADLRELRQQIEGQLQILMREVLYRDLARMFETFPDLVAMRLCFNGNLPLTSAVRPVWGSEPNGSVAVAFDTALANLEMRLKPADQRFMFMESTLLATWLRSPPDPIEPREDWGYVVGPAPAFLAQMAPDLVDWDRSQARSAGLAHTPAQGTSPRRRRS